MAWAKQAVDLVKAEIDRVRANYDALKTSVAAKMVESASNEAWNGQFSDNKEFGNLPPEIRDHLQTLVTESEGRFGLGSQGDAEGFLAGARVQGLRLVLMANLLLVDGNGNQQQTMVEIDIRSL